MTERTKSQIPMIQAQGLAKYYGDFVAVEGVSFAVPRGEVCAFLGPNGAGKSTTMKMLTGFLSPSAGTASIGGHDSQSDRLAASRLLGYLPENGPYYSEMTPNSFLRYVGKARLMSRPQLEERLKWVRRQCGLQEVWNKGIGKLSRGYRQRVGMAQALLHDPPVLILDEPTSGLDPNQVFGVRELILSLAETKTILLSTHILAEVHAVCGRVVMINDGRLVFDGPTRELGSDGEAIEAQFRALTTAK